MAVLQGMIQSAGLSRIYQHIQENNCGTISAFRQYRAGYENIPDEQRNDKQVLKEYKIPHSENMKRHKLLGAMLRQYGINTIQIEGVYKEAGSPKAEKEASYFCFATFNFRKELIGLGDTFEQDSITYAEQGDNFELIVAHSHTDSTGERFKSGEVIAEFDAGVVYGKNDTEAYSAIRGRPFAWGGWKATGVKAMLLAKDDNYRSYIAGLYPSQRITQKASMDRLKARISTEKGALDKLIRTHGESYFFRNALWG